jgi:hypothetical protein
VGVICESPLTSALLVQSLLLIVSQLALLQICLRYAPASPPPVGEESELGVNLTTQDQDQPTRTRPFNFWQWRGLGSYLESLAALIVVLSVLQVILGRFMWYIDA